MRSLELKVLPPVIALVIAVAMWAISRFTKSYPLLGHARVGTAMAILVAGIAFMAMGVFALRLSRTTLNPSQPNTTSALVTGGVYRVTRNPMYLGLFFVLIAIGLLLSTPWSLLGPLAFALYIDRFQVVPEERALTELFGDEYAAYKTAVRRWL